MGPDLPRLCGDTDLRTASKMSGRLENHIVVDLRARIDGVVFEVWMNNGGSNRGKASNT